MASESNFSDVLLTGQTAYTKKEGSMENFGKVIIDDQEHVITYGPGFIDENSKIKPAQLEKSQDYTDTLRDMKLYLGSDFIEETEDYLIKTNAENITNELAPRENKLQQIVDRINKYAQIEYLQPKTSGSMLTLSVPLHLTNNFLIEIKSNMLILNKEYDIIADENNKLTLKQTETGKFLLNNVEIPSITHTEDTLFSISQEDGTIYVTLNDDIIYSTAGFEGETDITLNLEFSSILYGLVVYDETHITDKFVPRVLKTTDKGGIHNLQKDLWYEYENEIKRYERYEYFEIWSGFLDLGYLVGPNTGIELDFRMYSSSTNSGWWSILGATSNYSIPNTVSFAFLIGDSAKYYASRNNNMVSWVAGATKNTTRSVCTINKNNDGKFIITGGATTNVALPGTVSNHNTGGHTLFLGALNDLGGYVDASQITSSDRAKCNCDVYVYELKIYEKDQLVRHFIPAKQLGHKDANASTGRKYMGLYDLIENKFYGTNLGSISMGSYVED